MITLSVITLSGFHCNWNPHTKLEFTKVAICTAFSSVAKTANKVKRLEFEEIDDQINIMQELKAKELNCNIFNDVLVNKINLALEELTAESYKLREKYSISLNTFIPAIMSICLLKNTVSFLLHQRNL
jgi:hypothetical protein